MLETLDEGATIKSNALTTVNLLAMQAAHWGKLSSLNFSMTEQNLTVSVISHSSKQ